MQNICKFNFNRSSDLVCDRFVYETAGGQASGAVAAHYLLGVVCDGDGSLECGGESHALARDTLFLICKGERFCVRGEGLCYLYISFDGRRAQELAERVGAFAGAYSFSLGDTAAHIAAFGMECLQIADDSNLDMLGEAVLLLALAHLGKEAKPHGDLIARILTLASEHFSEADFSLSSLAHELGYDAKYLSSVFKKKKGIPFTQYLRELRVKHAVFLIEQGLVSVKSIAILSGYPDALYFSKVFKQEMGESPRAYIERVQGDPVE